MIATVGRMDQLQEKGRVETLIRSLSRFSEKALLILSGQSDVRAQALTIDAALVFERLWTWKLVPNKLVCTDGT